MVLKVSWSWKLNKISLSLVCQVISEKKSALNGKKWSHKTHFLLCLFSVK